MTVKHKDCNSELIPEDLEAYTGYMDTYRDCIICKSRENRLWAKYGSYKAVKCNKCNFIWINPSLNEAGLNRYYQDYIGMRFKDEIKTRQRKLQYQIDKDFLQVYISSGKVLDVGCSGGFFLNVLSNNFDKYGVELDAKAVEYAKKKYSFGKNIFNLNLQDTKFPKGFFDLIIMRGVIEHLFDPLVVLKKVQGLLRKGGLFFICATPNVDSFCAKLYRQKWNQFHPIRHLFYFSLSSLSRLCSQFNLNLITKDFPYLETPYADIHRDHYEVLKAYELKNDGHFDKINRSPAFWGNMMSLVFKRD
ncbi:MAG: class I SAM-dependent methyltransferase [Candidatus Omnitrophica bacterium]|nr:class I SAM-dependent methyltransferase [Candidatus Omnitrophota bacterium]MDD5237465.1 class I SAM-dependent methyltransferase [Candidatus Omnitrophota bacterium]